MVHTRLAVRTFDQQQLLPTTVVFVAALFLAILTSGLVAATPAPKSLTLEQARQLAVSNNEQLKQAESSVFAAQADLAIAKSGSLPQLDLSAAWQKNFKKPSFFLPADMAAGFGGASKIDMGGDYDLQAALSMSLNLWTAGRLSAAKAAASSAVQATRWQKSLVEDAVRYNADVVYYGALLASAQVEISNGALLAAKEALRVTEVAVEQGTASRFDLLRAKVEMVNREAPLIQTQNALNLELLNLKRICGLNADVDLELLDQFQIVSEPAPMDQLLANMLNNSPELKALNQVVAARRQNVRLAKAGYGPVVQLRGQYAVQGQWDNDVLPASDEAATSLSASLAVSMPLFNGFETKAKVGKSVAELRSAEVELEKARSDRELSVSQARLYLESALAALEGRQDGVLLAEEAYRLAMVRMENGLSTPLEQLDTELALTEARAQLANILHSCNVARSTLELAVGNNTVNTTLSLEESK